MRISDWSSDVCIDDCFGVALNDIEQHQRRTTRDAVTPLPMAQGCCGKTKTGSKLLLSHPHLGSHCLHIDDARTMHTPAPPTALRMRDRSEERRAGKGCISTVQTRGSPTN